MSSNSSVTYAEAATRPQSPAAAKYVPVHRRTPSDMRSASYRSSSPTPSDASASSSQSRVYSIATLLQLSHEPEIKSIGMAQKEMIRQQLPEIVMNRKTRKAIEYHTIQERVREKSQLSQPQSPTPSTQQLRQRPGQRRQSRAVGADRRRNATKVVDEASWRALRPARLVSSAVPISAA